MPDTVTLKRDWDRQPKIGSAAGHHVAREKEDQALEDFVGRRDEGSLLVVGHRGSGKTSSVIAAVNRVAAKRGGGRPLLPILVRATSLGLGGGAEQQGQDIDSDDRILRGLIRALRRAARASPDVDKRLKGMADALYANAMASERAVESRSGRSWSWSAWDAASISAAVALSAIAALAIESPGGHAWTLIPLVLAPLVAKRALDWRGGRSVWRTYRRTYDSVDVQHDYEDMLSRFAEKLKVVFVLDEFDKVEGFERMVSPLKMIVNQGCAVYVFVTAPDKVGKTQARRSRDYTLFSETLFLKRPTFAEMERFIDGIVEESGALDGDGGYLDFKKYLCYRSRTDFFDLYGALRDHRAGADAEGRPVVATLLDDRRVTMANLQRAIDHVYGRKRYGLPSKQRVNDEMLDAMYDAAEAAEGAGGADIEVGEKAITFGGKELKHREPHMISAVRDFLLFLARQGYLKKDGSRYRRVGHLASFDPRGSLVEEERTFMAAHDSMVDALVDFANTVSMHLDEHGAPYSAGSARHKWDDMIRAVGRFVSIDIQDEATECRESLRAESPPLIEADLLRSHTDEAGNALTELRGRSVDLLAEMLESRAGLSMEVQDGVPDELWPTARDVQQDVRSAVRRGSKSGRTPLVAVVDASSPSVFSRVNEMIAGKGRRGKRIVVVLTGGTVPRGIAPGALAMGSAAGACGKPSCDYFASLSRRGLHVLIAASPPDPKTAAALVEAVGIIDRSIRATRADSPEQIWPDLQKAVQASL